MKITQEEYDNIVKVHKGLARPSILTRQGALKWRATVLDGDSLLFESRQVIPVEKISETLDKFYNDPAVGFCGRDRLFDKVQNVTVGISKRDIESYLNANVTNTRHRMPPKPKTVQPIITTRPYERLQMDFIDLKSLAYWNDGHKFVLTIIDCFTKFAWVIAMKNRSQEQIAVILENIFKNAEPKVGIMQCDNEFKGDPLNKVCKKWNVSQLYSLPYKPSTNGAIERFNRTLKGLIFKYLTNNATKIYVNVLPALTENYNSSRHGTTGFKPIEAQHHVDEVKDKIKSRASAMVSRDVIKLKKGDRVRISAATEPNYRKNKLLTKKYMPNYSEEVYVVATVSKGASIRYQLKDSTGKIIDKYFYAQDLLKIGDSVIEPEPVKTSTAFFNREEFLSDLGSREVVREPIAIIESVPVAVETPIRSRIGRVKKVRDVVKPVAVETPVRSRLGRKKIIRAKK
jgi:hypothetical protein